MAVTDRLIRYSGVNLVVFLTEKLGFTPTHYYEWSHGASFGTHDFIVDKSAKTTNAWLDEYETTLTPFERAMILP